MSRQFVKYTEFDAPEVQFALGADRKGQCVINMYYKTQEVAMLTPACVTNWPRVTGDGNFGTMWGPSDVTKAKFTLDLTDGSINGTDNEEFAKWWTILEQIDDKLLDFVHANQMRVLQRKNLSRDEVKMLQIRTVRPKYNKDTGAVMGHAIQMSATKFAWDGLGGKYERVINVCDKDGEVVTHGQVSPGDVVAATSYANQVYTGVGGDKFGIHWSFEDVQVVCQRTCLQQKTNVPAFGGTTYEFAAPYQSAASQTPAFDASAQFSEPMAVA